MQARFAQTDGRHEDEASTCVQLLKQTQHWEALGVSAAPKSLRVVKRRRRIKSGRTSSSAARAASPGLTLEVTELRATHQDWVTLCVEGGSPTDVARRFSSVLLRMLGGMSVPGPAPVAIQMGTYAVWVASVLASARVAPPPSPRVPRSHTLGFIDGHASA